MARQSLRFSIVNVFHVFPLRLETNRIYLIDVRSAIGKRSVRTFENHSRDNQYHVEKCKSRFAAIAGLRPQRRWCGGSGIWVAGRTHSRCGHKRDYECRNEPFIPVSRSRDQPLNAVTPQLNRDGSCPACAPPARPGLFLCEVKGCVISSCP